MPRVTRGTQHTKRRRSLLERTKGYKWGRKSKIKLAKTAILKAGAYAFRDRRAKKRSFRRLWNVKINAVARELGTTYSQLINALAKRNSPRPQIARALGRAQTGSVQERRGRDKVMPTKERLNGRSLR